MQAADIPRKFDIPFANAAGPTYITYPVPELSQIGVADGRASLTDGFPPLNFLPLATGGVPPFGQDMNGLLKQITLWAQWQGAGGPSFYDAIFAAAVSGYPKGAQLSSKTTDGLVWVNTVDGNATDPDSGGAANWLAMTDLASSQLQQGNYAVDVGATNAYVVNPSPAIGSYTPGLVMRVKASSTNTGAATMNISGKGIKNVVDTAGNALRPGDIVAGHVFEVCYNGTTGNLEKTSFTPAPQSVAGSSGYVRIPGSLLTVAWVNFSIPSFTQGTNTIAGTIWDQKDVTLPISFANGTIWSFASMDVQNNGQCIFSSVGAVTASGAVVYITATSNSALPVPGRYVAIGF